MPARYRIFRILSLLLAIALFPAWSEARQKTDLVFLDNGDRLTGEIKQLSRGILQLSTSGISTVSIEWADIDSVNSVYQFRVEDRAGNKLFGTIFLRHDGIMEIIQKNEVRTVPKDSVVVITPIEASFWHQLDGSLSVGYSYTKSDATSQANLNGSVMRRTTLNKSTLALSATAKSTSTTATTNRYDASFQQRRLRRSIWYVEGTLGAQRNDEQNLDLRTSLAATMGANLVKSNRVQLVSSAGLSVNREFNADGSKTDNFEGVLSAEHEIFAYNFPKTNYSADAALYPSLSDLGRIRLNLNVQLRREVVSDFFVEGTYYLNYDNRPPAGGAQSDFGLTFNLGYSF